MTSYDANDAESQVSALIEQCAKLRAALVAMAQNQHGDLCWCGSSVPAAITVHTFRCSLARVALTEPAS